MGKRLVAAFALALCGASFLLHPAASAQTADDPIEVTQAELENLVLSGQFTPGVYIVDGVYMIIEGGGTLPDGATFDPFGPIPDEYFAGVPDEYRFLVDPTLPLPAGFEFLDDPTLPVPPEWAFLIDARQPVPPEFQWLLGPMPADMAQPVPATPVPTPTVEATPVAETVEETEPTSEPAEPTLDAEPDEANEAEQPAAVATEVPAPPLSEIEVSADPFADAANNSLAALQVLQQSPAQATDRSADNFIVPLLVFVAVASTAMLAIVPIFLRGRSKNDRALRELALTDDLTKLANRRRLDRDLGNHERARRPIAVAMIDIDHFKRLNDDFSHAIGDVVLQQVAATIAANIRTSDIAYRYGGEEFCVLLPDATEHEAASVVERVRSAIEHIVFPQLDRRVTISAGIAVTSTNGVGEHGNVTVQRADAALYAAKDAGRNRVMLGSLVG